MPVAKREPHKQLYDDANQVGGVFVELQQAFRDADFRPLFEGWFQRLRNMHAGFFSGQKDASGSAWAPLKPSTVKRKGHARILVDKGALQSSLISKGGNHIEAATAKGFVFGTADEKAGFHQEGTSRMPARPPVGMTEDDLDALTNDIADQTVELLKG